MQKILLTVILPIISVIGGWLGGCTLADSFQRNANRELEAWGKANIDIGAVEAEIKNLGLEFEAAKRVYENARAAGDPSSVALLAIVEDTAKRLAVAGQKLEATKAMADAAKQTYERTKADIEKEGGGWQNIVGGILGATAAAAASVFLGGKVQLVTGALKVVTGAIDSLTTKDPKAHEAVIEEIRELRPNTTKELDRFKATINKAKAGS